jgi:hypothetical protein
MLHGGYTFPTKRSLLDGRSSPIRTMLNSKMAERVGFEPTMPLRA